VNFNTHINIIISDVYRINKHRKNEKENKRKKERKRKRIYTQKYVSI